MSTSDPEVTLDKSEADAIEEAVDEVGELLNDSKSLDMIEQHIYRIRRKKQMAEMSLKNAVETQLNGVRSGLLILQTVLQDADDICGSMREVNGIYSSLAEDLKENFKEIKDTRVIHKEHALLHNYLQSIYGFKNDVQTASKCIYHDELLKAHEILMKLEDCRDGVFREVMVNDMDDEKRSKVQDFFSGLDELNKGFVNKIHFFTRGSLNSIRSGNTAKLVSILRIIEREEKKDAMMAASDHLEYPGRPKKWKEKALTTMTNSISETFEGVWEIGRTDSSWVLKFVQKIKALTESDLRVVHQHLQYCFPPHWEIQEFFCSQYQTNIRLRLTEIIETIRTTQGDASSYIIVFNWSNVLNNIIKPYRHHDKRLISTLTPDNIHTLVQSYTARLDYELTKQTEKILKQERDDRYDLNSDPKSRGYSTTTPVIFYEMINQNLEFAFKLTNLELIPVLVQLDSKIKFFIDQYVADLEEFKEKYYSEPPELREDMQYVEWLMTACNNAIKCANLNDELVASLSTKRDQVISGQDLLDNLSKLTDRGTLISDKSSLFVSDILVYACNSLADLVFTDLKTIMSNLFTSDWVGKNGLQTVQLTLDDYNQSFFVDIEESGHRKLLSVLANKLLLEYLIVLFNTKALTISADEFRDLLVSDHGRIQEFFKKKLKMGEEFPEDDYDALKIIAELVSETEDLVEIVMADFTNRYPDVMYDQCVALLALRGDMNGKEIRDLVTRNNITENQAPSNNSVFGRTHQVTGPLSSRFFQTVVASNRAFNRPAANLNTSVASVTSTTSLSKITGNISNAISNSPMYHAINQAWNEKDQITGKAVRALDFSNAEVYTERTNPFYDASAREGKGPAPRPPPKRKGPAPAPPTKSTNPFDDDEEGF